MSFSSSKYLLSKLLYTVLYKSSSFDVKFQCVYNWLCTLDVVDLFECNNYQLLANT